LYVCMYLFDMLMIKDYSLFLWIFFLFKLKELGRDRLLVELARERSMVMDARGDSQAKASSLTAAAVGASVGAGLGIVLAVVMGAASALRKPWETAFVFPIFPCIHLSRSESWIECSLAVSISGHFCI
jgi:hypothetical protein